MGLPYVQPTQSSFLSSHRLSRFESDSSCVTCCSRRMKDAEHVVPFQQVNAFAGRTSREEPH